MSYTQLNLRKDETVIAEAQFSKGSLILIGILMGIVFLVGFILCTISIFTLYYGLPNDVSCYRHFRCKALTDFIFKPFYYEYANRCQKRRAFA